MDSTCQKSPDADRAVTTRRRTVAVLPLVYLLVASHYYSALDAQSPFYTLLRHLGASTLCSLEAYLRAGLPTRAYKVYYGLYGATTLVNAGLVGAVMVLGRQATRPYVAHGLGASGLGSAAPDSSTVMSMAMWGSIVAGLVAGVTVQGLLVLPLTRQVVEYEKEQAKGTGPQ